MWWRRRCFKSTQGRTWERQTFGGRRRKCVRSQGAAGVCFKVFPSPTSVWWYNWKSEQNEPPLRSERWCVPYSLFVYAALAWVPFFYLFFHGWDPWNDSAEIRNWDDSIPTSFRPGESEFLSLLFFASGHGWNKKRLISPPPTPLASSGLVSTFHIQAVRLNKGKEQGFFQILLPSFLFLDCALHTFLSWNIRLSWHHQIWTSVLRHHCTPTEKTLAAVSTLIFHPKLQLPDWEFIFLNIIFQQEKLLCNGGWGGWTSRRFNPTHAETPFKKFC